MSRAELMAPIGIGEDAVVLREVVEPMPRGPRHQPRLRAGTRVRVRGLVGERYVVETCDARAAGTGRWAMVGEDDLGEAPALRLLDWLRSRRT